MGSQSLQYLKHTIGAKSIYSIHSPFVYEFMTKVLPHKNEAIFGEINELRKRLLSDETVLELEDYGAGYGGKSQRIIQKKVSAVAESSARKRREGALLYRMCNFYQPKHCLELGTNLGLSTLYQYKGVAAPDKFITIEGAKALAEKAAEHFSKFDIHPEIIAGEFSEVLQNKIDWDKFKPEYVFIDGHHTYDATLQNFELILPRMTEISMIVFDDIYWSSGMAKAWDEIRKHPQVSISLDLFHFGICFMGRNQAKEHFRLRF